MSSSSSSRAAIGELCPSARCQPGAVLLGVVGPEGRVGFLSPALTVGEDFIDTARRGRSPEKRFRFADTCVTSDCQQWTGTRCGVIEQVLASEEAGQALLQVEAPLPRCGIRSRCRWFAEERGRACSVCPLVVTDMRADVESGVPTPALQPTSTE